MLTTLLFYCLLTSLVSVGIFLVTEKGYLLYFLKKPVEQWIEDLENERNDELALLNRNEQAEIDFHKYEKHMAGMNYESKVKYINVHYNLLRKGKRDYYDNQINFITNLYKPIFFCPRCMASVWSLFIFLPLSISEYGTSGLLYLFPAMLITATLNSLLHKIIEQ